MISCDEVAKVDIRVGTIVQTESCPEARRAAVKLAIDFGEDIGIKKRSAQITKHYTPESLIGMKICALTNFPPKQIGPFMSEVLVLGFSDEAGDIVLIAPDQAVPNGAKLH